MEHEVGKIYFIKEMQIIYIWWKNEYETKLRLNYRKNRNQTHEKLTQDKKILI